MGDAQSFLPGHDAADESGHGTHVAGIALYGDLEESIKAGAFIPALRLFSGRILDRNNENTGLIENHIDAAVRYFHDESGKVLAEHPNVSVNLLRALLLAHAKIPSSTSEILDKSVLRMVVGYGSSAPGSADKF